jgi:hypothetical protein
MTNPLVHAIVLVLAIIIPGGLLVYLGWRAHKAKEQRVNSQRPTPEEAAAAFRAMYPTDSLRARSRADRLMRVRARRHKKSTE